jgi:hypothetical protein
MPTQSFSMRYILLLAMVCCACISTAKNNPYKAARKLANATSQRITYKQPVTFTYQKTSNAFGHLSVPWKTYETKVAGNYCITHSQGLYIADSVLRKTKNLPQTTIYTPTVLASKSYWAKDLANVTEKDRTDFLYEAALYSPAYVLHDFLKQEEANFLRYTIGSYDTIVYQRNREEEIHVIINAAKKEVTSIAICYAHDMYGDVWKYISYKDYKKTGSYTYPSAVTGMEHDILLTDMTTIGTGAAIDTLAMLSSLPKDYSLKKDDAKEPPTIQATKMNDHIYLLNLPHTQEQSLLINFENHIAIAEAPLNTANGTLIIEKAKELFPGKPIRYFMAGHHHPHYLGGMRAFVHNGSTILCTPGDTAYVKQLATFRHTLKPDILEKEPKPLQMQTINEEQMLTDGKITMRILHIGSMSQHTEDYLVYYFPEYKLLFEDDIAWVSKDKPLSKASERQQGLYDAIQKHGLDVDTIVQGWPTSGYDVKTIFTFAELEASVKMP